MKGETEMSEPVVLYHAGCWDGFCAAWVLRKKWPEAEFKPVRYGEAPPDVTGRVVFVVDFSYPVEQMRGLCAQARSVTLLDHHKTALPLLKELDDVRNLSMTIEMDKSGGRLAWEFIGRPGGAEGWVPWLIGYTEDRDLWRWALPDSRAINACLRSYPLDMEVWDELDQSGHGSFVEGGKAILRREAQIIDEHVKHARVVVIAGHQVLAVNATVLFSEIAGKLARHRPFGVAYFIRQDCRAQYSLRSRGDGGVDVSKVAKLFGGGGHEHAAGFESDIVIKKYLSPDGAW